MAFDPRELLTEDLYEPSKIRLFGKPFRSLRFVRDDLLRTPYRTPAKGQDLPIPPPRLERNLLRDFFGVKRRYEPEGAGAAVTEAEVDPNDVLEPILARIYSFSYEGHYYKLPRPLIYLVRGEGGRPEAIGVGDEGAGPPRFGQPPFETTDVGVEAKDWRFGSDIRVWKVDEEDITVCIDLDVGRFEDVLLCPLIDWLDDGASGGAGASSRAKATARAKVASRAASSARAKAVFRSAMTGAHQD